ncbi:MAG: TadE/TadG family type IV pilus assembly protein [Stellaceae bacterium]
MSARRRQAPRRGLAADRTGTAAVEFALLFPIMLTLFIGSYEVENVLLAQLKVTAAAETAADLVAQTTIAGGANKNGVLQTSDFTGFTSAAADVLTPLPTGTGNSLVKIAFASVTYSTGTPVIDWHVEENGATAISLTNIPNNQSLANLGNAAVNSLDSVIVVQVQYTYTSPLTYVLNASYTLSEAAFNRPRYVTCVPDYKNAVNASTNVNQCP